ncbi:dioxygenase family protein [Flavobacterium silvaticum]|uniref:Intradiol ring-cleavage dioxygenase n=1 Tax=Flavobacterium silvaticum TaxID=1852020 RepID=A0A972FNJ6_9FLAO|nr:intradiol ring-cleavage dioxygenase [Flavobacterium silvaticum]NMH28525.1 intradiol ring-cleavage dioxygenase [Flavobacterium silvaticum]
MERKDFLKGLGLFGLGMAVTPLVVNCSSDDSQQSNVDQTGDCSVSPSETTGPFPTHSPSSLVQTDIRGDRTGILLNIAITLLNANASDAALDGALIDIWHCDKDGNYSEYGGTQMQSVDYTSNHFLRGRQTSNSGGEVYFTSIFPGWYSGRSTHIHVHVYDASGNSLLVTQIAFPEATGSAVELVNASTENGYTKGMNGYTYNAQDNVFSDSYTCEIASVTGDVTNGFTLESTLYVPA